MGDLRIFNLKNFIDKYKIETFVETGTFMGDGVQWAIENNFNNIYSIEIDSELASKTKHLFINKKNVFIVNDNSVNGLNKILESVTTNCLFWLDAHFPSADAHKVSYDNEKDINLRAPLELEIDIIKKRLGHYKDTLIIDDLWLYEDGPFEWGSFNEHSKRHNMNVTREELMNGKNLDNIYDIFKETHKIEKDYRHQGYLIITPK